MPAQAQAHGLGGEREWAGGIGEVGDVEVQSAEAYGDEALRSSQSFQEGLQPEGLDRAADCESRDGAARERPDAVARCHHAEPVARGG